MPLELQSRTVPHLKALINGDLEPRDLRCGSFFTLCHTFLKSAILLHTEAFARIFFCLSVEVPRFDRS